MEGIRGSFVTCEQLHVDKQEYDSRIKSSIVRRVYWKERYVSGAIAVKASAMKNEIRCVYNTRILKFSDK